MSSAARFLLEFEATGDQEVVAKIKAVGAAGKQTATDLESLRGIEDPFEPIATGADAAVAPIEGVGTAAESAITPIEGLGTAAEGAVTPLTDMGGATEELGGIFSGAGTDVDTFGGSLDAIGTSGEAAAGGLTDANTMVGDFGESAATSGDKTSGFGSDVASVGGAVTALGGSIGTVVSTLFRYNAAQLSVEKANLAAARAAEIYRKSEEGIDKILATATSNTDAIAAARARLSAAQKTLNDLVAAGVTSGPEYEAALAEVQAAQAALAVEAGKGGVNVSKLTDAMEKSELAAGKAGITTKNAAKEQAELNKVILDSVFGFTSMGGSLVQVASAMGKGKTAAGNLIAKMGGKAGLAGTLLAVAAAAVAVYEAFKAMEALPSMVKLAEQLKTGDVDKVKTAWAAYVDKVKQIPGINELLGGSLDNVSNKLAVASKESETLNRIFPTLSSGASTAEEGVTNLSGGTQKLGSDMSLSTHQAAELANMLGQNTEVQNQLTEAETKEGPVIGDLITKRVLLGAALAEDIDRYEKSRQMTDLQVAATEKLAGSTVNLNRELTAMSTVIPKLTQADVDRITTLEESNRAMLVANAGYNNANLAAIQYQQALTAMTQSLVDDTDQKNANAQATLALVDSELNAQNAIATVNEEYANSVDRLADLNTVLGDNEARTKAVATVSNEFAASLKEQSIELEGTLQALQDVENQEQGVANAILQTKVSLEESNQAYREAMAVRNDAAAASAQLQTALNEERTALLEDETAMQASMAAVDDLGIRMMRLGNAYDEGVLSIEEWAAGLKEAEANQAGQIQALEDMGATFDKLPSAMAPTIDNLKLYHAALDGSAEDVQAWADAQSEAYATVQEAGNQMVNDLSDALNKGGDSLSKITDKWLEDMPEQFRERLDESQIVAIEGMAELQAIAKANKFELEADLKTESLDKARSDFIGNIKQMRSEAKPEFKGIYDEAIEIAEQGTADQMHRVAEILESDDPWPVMLEKLKAIKLEQEGKRLSAEMLSGIKGGFTGNAVIDDSILANQIGMGSAPAAGNKVGTAAAGGLVEGYTGNAVIDDNTLSNMIGMGTLPAKAGTAGGQAGAAFVSEWDANVQLAGNALQSIVKTASTLKVEIPITANVQQAGAALASIQKTGSTLKVQIPVTADVSQAHQAIAALVTKQQTATITYKIVTTGTPPVVKPITTTITYSYKITGKPPVAKPIKGFISYAYRITNKIPNPKEIKRFISYAYRITNKIPNPPEIKRWITYKYRVVGSRPNPPNLNRTITYRYRTVGSRPAQFGMHENLAQDTMIAAHKGERVDITPGASAGNTTRTIESGVRGTKTAGEIVIPVTLMLDNKVLIRTVRRGLVEEVSGTM